MSTGRPAMMFVSPHHLQQQQQQQQSHLQELQEQRRNEKLASAIGLDLRVPAPPPQSETILSPAGYLTPQWQTAQSKIQELKAAVIQGKRQMNTLHKKLNATVQENVDLRSTMRARSSQSRGSDDSRPSSHSGDRSQVASIWNTTALVSANLSSPEHARFAATEQQRLRPSIAASMGLGGGALPASSADHDYQDDRDYPVDATMGSGGDSHVPHPLHLLPAPPAPAQPPYQYYQQVFPTPAGPDGWAQSASPLRDQQLHYQGEVVDRQIYTQAQVTWPVTPGPVMHPERITSRQQLLAESVRAQIQSTVPHTIHPPLDMTRPASYTLSSPQMLTTSASATSLGTGSPIRAATPKSPHTPHLSRGSPSAKSLKSPGAPTSPTAAASIVRPGSRAGLYQNTNEKGAPSLMGAQILSAYPATTPTFMSASVSELVERQRHENHSLSRTASASSLRSPSKPKSVVERYLIRRAPDADHPSQPVISIQPATPNSHSNAQQKAHQPLPGPTTGWPGTRSMSPPLPLASSKPAATSTTTFVQPSTSVAQPPHTSAPPTTSEISSGVAAKTTQVQVPLAIPSVSFAFDPALPQLDISPLMQPTPFRHNRPYTPLNRPKLHYAASSRINGPLDPAAGGVTGTAMGLGVTSPPPVAIPVSHSTISDAQFYLTPASSFVSAANKATPISGVGGLTINTGTTTMQALSHLSLTIPSTPNSAVGLVFSSAPFPPTRNRSVSPVGRQVQSQVIPASGQFGGHASSADEHYRAPSPQAVPPFTDMGSGRGHGGVAAGVLDTMPVTEASPLLDEGSAGLPEGMHVPAGIVPMAPVATPHTSSSPSASTAPSIASLAHHGDAAVVPSPSLLSMSHHDPHDATATTTATTVTSADLGAYPPAEEVDGVVMLTHGMPVKPLSHPGVSVPLSPAQHLLGDTPIPSQIPLRNLNAKPDPAVPTFQLDPAMSMASMYHNAPPDRYKSPALGPTPLGAVTIGRSKRAVPPMVNPSLKPKPDTSKGPSAIAIAHTDLHKLPVLLGAFASGRQIPLGGTAPVGIPHQVFGLAEPVPTFSKKGPAKDVLASIELEADRVAPPPGHALGAVASYSALRPDSSSTSAFKTSPLLTYGFKPEQFPKLLPTAFIHWEPSITNTPVSPMANKLAMTGNDRPASVGGFYSSPYTFVPHNPDDSDHPPSTCHDHTQTTQSKPTTPAVVIAAPMVPIVDPQDLRLGGQSPIPEGFNETTSPGIASSPTWGARPALSPSKQRPRSFAGQWRTGSPPALTPDGQGAQGHATFDFAQGEFMPSSKDGTLPFPPLWVEWAGELPGVALQHIRETVPAERSVSPSSRSPRSSTRLQSTTSSRAPSRGGPGIAPFVTGSHSFNISSATLPTTPSGSLARSGSMPRMPPPLHPFVDHNREYFAVNTDQLVTPAHMQPFSRVTEGVVSSTMMMDWDVRDRETLDVNALPATQTRRPLTKETQYFYRWPAQSLGKNAQEKYALLHEHTVNRAETDLQRRQFEWYLHQQTLAAGPAAHGAVAIRAPSAHASRRGATLAAAASAGAQPNPPLVTVVPTLPSDPSGAPIDILPAGGFAVDEAVDPVASLPPAAVSAVIPGGSSSGNTVPTPSLLSRAHQSAPTSPTAAAIPSALTISTSVPVSSTWAALDAELQMPHFPAPDASRYPLRSPTASALARASSATALRQAGASEAARAIGSGVVQVSTPNRPTTPAGTFAWQSPFAEYEASHPAEAGVARRVVLPPLTAPAYKDYESESARAARGVLDLEAAPAQLLEKPPPAELHPEILPPNSKIDRHRPPDPAKEIYHHDNVWRPAGPGAAW